MDAELNQAWRDERVPLVNAIAFADGGMILLDVENYSNGPTTVRALGRTTLASFLSFNPEWWAEVTPMSELRTPSGDVVMVGEGPQGGDGFIALCKPNGDLQFCAFFTRSNPFVGVSLSADATAAVAMSNRGEQWSVNLSQPWKIHVTPPTQLHP